MTRLEAIYAAVLADPHADMPRLVYADALDDAGEHDRAEFVRVQCVLAAGRCRTGAAVLMSVEECGCEWCRHKLRERELWAGLFKGAETPVGWFGDGWQFSGTQKRLRHERGLAGITVRGFMGEVRSPLSVLFGGPCGRCDGEGVFPSSASGYASEGVCSACDAGRTPGIASDLFARHPIEAVELTDREPYDTGGKFSWWLLEPDDRHDITHPPSNIGRELFECLTGGELRTGDHRAYGSREDADADLSRAAVVVGRRRAGRMPAGDFRAEMQGV